MTAEDWQAGCEVLGVLWILANAIFIGLYYRLLASFVTREEHAKMVVRGDAEHAKMSDRVGTVEDRVDAINGQIGRLATTDDLGEVYNRLGAVERQGAEVLGKMGGIHDQMNAANNMLQMLVKNELDGAHRS